MNNYYDPNYEDALMYRYESFDDTFFHSMRDHILEVTWKYNENLDYDFWASLHEMVLGICYV